MAAEVMLAREGGGNSSNTQNIIRELSVNPNRSLARRTPSYTGFPDYESRTFRPAYAESVRSVAHTGSASAVRGSIMERANVLLESARTQRDVERINRAMNNQLGRVSTPRLSQATLQREFEDAQRRVRNRRR